MIIPSQCLVFLQMGSLKANPNCGPLLSEKVLALLTQVFGNSRRYLFSLSKVIDSFLLLNKKMVFSSTD